MMAVHDLMLGQLHEARLVNIMLVVNLQQRVFACSLCHKVSSSKGNSSSPPRLTPSSSPLPPIHKASGPWLSKSTYGPVGR